jgi:hypothetical protein
VQLAALLDRASPLRTAREATAHRGTRGVETLDVWLRACASAKENEQHRHAGARRPRETPGTAIF